ncbi:MAG: hypothetical protein AAFV88_25510 [Planctomycetota bacterium]
MRHQYSIACSMIVAAALSAGCASRGGILGVDCCADVPSGAIPEPAGTKVCAWQTQQVNAAFTDQTVLYQADFVDRTSQLSPSALQRLSRQSQLESSSEFVWVLEPSGDADLDSGRVGAVVEALAARGRTAAEVRIATPAALGLRGPQAERIARGTGSTQSSLRGTGASTSRPSSLGGFGGGLRGF